MTPEDKTIKFEFPKDYKAIIDNASILEDFETFIQMIEEGLIELSKQNAPTSTAAKLVNSRIVTTIPMLMKRPLLKSYPNVLALFLLFSASGLAISTKKGTKKYLGVNTPMLQQWRALTDVDKYFYLVTIACTNFTFEQVGERNDKLIDGYSSSQIRLVNKTYTITKQDKSYYSNSFTFKTKVILFRMFGWISITHEPPTEGLGLEITSITPHHFLEKLYKSIQLYFQNTLFSVFEDIENRHEEAEEDESFLTINDFEEVQIINRFSDHIMESIPEHRQRLNFQTEKKLGIYQFKVNLGKTSCVLKIDSRYTLDVLCTVILEVFKFDYDHLYDVSFMSIIGRKLTFNGAPEMNYAETPRTGDILLESLPINVGGELKFTYDYGDQWEFEILLQAIDTTAQAKTIPPIEVSDVKGKLPKQYNYGDEDDW